MTLAEKNQALEQKAPALVPLVAKVDDALKKKDLLEHRARVALCIDISGSMYNLFRSGKVQNLAERVLALGYRFDDNGAIDVFLFGKNAHEAGEMTIENFSNFISGVTDQYPLEGGTYYGRAIKMIRKFYYPDGQGGQRTSPVKDTMPVYVMFITDGETFDKDETRQLITWGAYEPIFWQFMGLGTSKKDVKAKGLKGFFSGLAATDFGFLETLDEMGGRFVDNANFFSIKDPAEISEDDLYALMMDEYPDWIKLAKSKGLLG
jgi:hypothetical protein